MKKIIQRIAMLTAIAVALLCMGIFASACSATEFTVTVCYSDGTVVDGTNDALTVQICDAGGAFCYGEVPAVDANGVVKFDIAKVNSAAEGAGVKDKAYVVHVWRGNEQLTFKDGEVKVDSSNPSVKVVLSVTAP